MGIGTGLMYGGSDRPNLATMPTWATQVPKKAYRVTVWRRFTICAAHYLPRHPKCGTTHGHNYTIELAVEGPIVNGMVVDFGELKRIFEEAVKSRYDHAFLNDFPEFEMPTVENMVVEVAHLLYEPMKALFPAHLRCVRIYETNDCWCELWLP